MWWLLAIPAAYLGWSWYRDEQERPLTDEYHLSSGDAMLVSWSVKNNVAVILPSPGLYALFQAWAKQNIKEFTSIRTDGVLDTRTYNALITWTKNTTK
jgi:hypothetical protein